MTELRGCVQDFGLAALVPATAELGRSRRLRLRQTGWLGELVFDQGVFVGGDLNDVVLDRLTVELPASEPRP